ncbi:MAG TPA: glycosyltransferase [Thermoleophilaceae bacterium]|nr:glycosyltransferase [Thermoleophilaceae bacterium]
MITFAVVGHNEVALLANALEQAHAASRSGDRVWFVDSASSDGSGELARRLGTEVLRAPLGKGRAVATAVERCRTTHICLIDADLESTTANAPETLRDALKRTGADMVVGEFDWPEKPFRPVTTMIWEPLAGALFPEALRPAGRVPLSGFRILDVALARGTLPEGFGLEVHLNIVGSLDGRRTETAHFGSYAGPVRPNPGLPAEVAAAILDLAESRGRLAASARAEWEAWLEPVLALIADTTADDHARRTLLTEAAARPLPGYGARLSESRGLYYGGSILGEPR